MGYSFGGLFALRALFPASEIADRHVIGSATIPNAYLMYEQLRERSCPGLSIGLEVLDGETHMTEINSTVMPTRAAQTVC